jgi:regulator of chromosome condensation
VVATQAGAAGKQGECFVYGTGDAGQLGLGDDLMELPRPRLLSTLPAATPVLKVYPKPQTQNPKCCKH